MYSVVLKNVSNAFLDQLSSCLVKNKESPIFAYKLAFFTYYLPSFIRKILQFILRFVAGPRISEALGYNKKQSSKEIDDFMTA